MGQLLLTSDALEAFLTASVFAFILTFVRMGTALMIMPGLGDFFVTERIRLMIALSVSFALFPLTMKYMPAEPPGTVMLLTLIVSEFMIGLFFGTVARIFMAALDTAGMLVSISSSLSNAQIFNPAMAGQGSLIGALLSMTGLAILFAANLHHLLLSGIVESYKLFPVGAMPDAGGMSEFLARTVSASFLIGVKLSAPFIVLTMLIYVGMGVLSRLMPQVQVFLLAIPVQIALSMVLMTFVLSAMLMFWAAEFEKGMVFFLSMTP